MEVKPVQRIVLIGAGKLATQLGLALKQKGIDISQVINRNPEHGKKLAQKLKAPFISAFSTIRTDADLYIIAVSDDAIPGIVDGLRIPGKLLVHTSGSVDMDVLKPASSRIGVFYPLQTFSLRKHISFRGIPLCIEAGMKADEKILSELGIFLSGKVRLLNSEQRRILHLTAVFANNFTNFMYTIAEDLLHRHNIPFDLLQPLIKQTAKNAGVDDPFRQQTGPAVREDNDVMNRHRAMLSGHKVYLEIYNLISKSIIQYKETHGKL